MVRKGYSKFIKLIHFSGDIFLLNLVFLLSYLFYNQINPLFSFNDHYIFLLIAFNLLWLLLGLTIDPYEIGRVMKNSKIVLNTIKVIFLHSLLIFAVLASIKGYYYSRGHLLLTYSTLSFVVVLWRLLFVYLLQIYRRSGSNYRNIVIIGAGPAGVRLYEYLQSDPTFGFRLLGFFDDYPARSAHKNLILGRVEALKEFALRERVDEIYYTLPLFHTYKVRDLMSFADNNLIRFMVIPDFPGFFDKKVSIDFYDNIPVLTARKEPMENIFNLILKRVFDIVFSLGVILLIFPWVFPVIMLAIKLTSKGPVFFRQKRTGKNNKEFYCYKFRTMYVNEQSDTVQATANDSRITPIGKYLRDFSIDELPQFFNVLFGDMTVVGPRPHMLKHTHDYSKVVDKFMVRHFVKPGITGLAQVKGYRGETKNTDKMVKRVNHDLWYMENWSFFLDLKIIFLTVFSIFKGNDNVA